MRQEAQPPKKQMTILEYFRIFKDEKQRELLFHYNSERVYNSLLTTLIAFDKHYKLSFESINAPNKLFFHKFREFSNNNMNHIDNTVSKNVSILKKFIKDLQDRTNYNFKSSLLDYKVKKAPAQVVTLSEDELKEIYTHQDYNKFERRLIDVFVFMCMTSIRYGDYEQLDNATIEIKQEGKREKVILSKVNQKTKTNIRVPLNATALEIWQKYNSCLPKYANGYYNHELKEIFKKYNLLNSEYTKTSIKAGRPVVKKGLKRDFITVHKSRSTFITLMINNNIPLTEIMPITGHRQVTTLNTYTDQHFNPSVTNKIAL